MNKLIIFLLTLAICETSCKQHKVNADSANVTYLITDSSILKNYDSPLDQFLDIHSDSLNNAGKTGLLPTFLKDADFDLHHTGFSSPHSPEGLRRLIMERVTNCQSLRLFLSKDAPVYKLKPENPHKINILDADLSFYDLARERLSRLGCE